MVMATKEIKKTTKRASTFKWDVVAAEKEYLENHTMSLADIAGKYGVNIRTVSRYAKEHEWTLHRQEAISAGLNQHKSEHAKLISDTNTEDLKKMRSLENAAMAAVKRAHDSKDDKGLRNAGAVLVLAINTKRTVLGMPTFIKKEADDDDEALKPTNFIEAAKRAEEMLREAGELGDESK